MPEEKVIVPFGQSEDLPDFLKNLFGNIAKICSARDRESTSAVSTAKDEADHNLKKYHSAGIIPQSGEELTERFVRGDASRNTEGSGLGLAIAKSFTEIQGGKFRIELDGDLFKVVLIWK